MEGVFSGIHTCIPIGSRNESVNTVGFLIIVPFSFLKGSTSLSGSSEKLPRFPKFMLEMLFLPAITSRNPEVTLYAAILYSGSKNSFQALLDKVRSSLSVGLEVRD